MGRFEIKVSQREDDWSAAASPLLDEAPLQTTPDTPGVEPQTASAPGQTFDTPEFAGEPRVASAPGQTTDTPEFAGEPRVASAPGQTVDTPEFLDS